LTARVDEEIVVIDLVLLPAFRNRGIGTALLRELQQQAQAEQLSLCLHVLINSPARRLYTRLGFREDGFSIPFLRMRWKP
jgi:predicted GNAT family acetyltransferase